MENYCSMKKKYCTMEKKVWYNNENYGISIYYGKNYGNIETKLWYFIKLLLTIVNYGLL